MVDSEIVSPVEPAAAESGPAERSSMFDPTSAEDEAAEDVLVTQLFEKHGLEDDEEAFAKEIAELSGEPAPEPEQPEATPAKPEVLESPEPQVGEAVSQALRREGYTDEDIQALDPGLAQRIADRATEQANRRQAEYEKLKASPEKGGTETTEGQAGEPEAHPESLVEAVQPLAQELGLDDDGVAKLQSFGQSLLKEAARSIPDTAGMNELAHQNALEMQRMRLEMRYPQLSDDAMWTQAIEKAQSLDGSKYQGNLRGFFDAAVKLMDIEPLDPAASARHQQLAAQRDLGAPTVQTMRQPPREMSADERETHDLMKVFKEHGLDKD